MKNIDRRGFLRTGLAGAAGIALAQSAICAGSDRPDGEIIYRTLGKTGLKVPVISFGVMRSDNPGLCKAAYDRGIKLFDTANGYQNGNNETMLGNLFRDIPRDTFYLATKVKAAGMTREGLPTAETTADDFLAKFNESLSRLKMDYVDILYVHDISNPEYLKFKPIVNAAKKIKKDGRARFIGFSTHRNEPAVIEAASQGNDWDVILTSYNFQQAYRKELDAAVKKAAAAGIGIVAMKTLAGGGFLDKEKKMPINSGAAIRWVLSNPDIHTTIPGMTQFDQLDSNAMLLTDITLTEQDKKDLLLAGAEPGLYCSGCNKCYGKCPKGFYIPDLMRAYMYAYGYGNPLEAQVLLTQMGYGKNPCGDCAECHVECGKGFRIREKVADVSRLVDVPSEFLA